MNDMISRQTAIDAVSKSCFELRGVFEECKSELLALPSAQPERKTGRWIYGQDELFVSCSECGMETTRNELKGIALFGEDEPKFCPNCGAKMEGEGMSDLIDRQKLLYDIEKHHVSDGKFQHWVQIQQQAQPEQRWISFNTRPLTEEETEDYPEWDCILDCKLPDDGQKILVSINVRGHESVQCDEFFTDDGSYLDSGYEIGTEAVAWMPLPEPYKGE